VKPFRLSRRTMLRGAGGVFVALPVLEAMAPRRANAAVGSVPKRLVIFYSPNGTNDQATGVEGFSGGLPAGPLTNATLPTEAAPLDALKHKLLIVSGVNAFTSASTHDGQGDLHSIGMSELLTGVKSTYVGGPTFEGALPPMVGQGISVDQHIANAVGDETVRRSLQYGVQSEVTASGEIDGFCRMSYGGPGQPLPSTMDPAEMFARMFADGDQGDAALAAARAQRRSVLDFVMDDFERLEGEVGLRDRRALDAHLTAVRELELSLSMPPATPESCDADAMFENDGDPLDPAAFPAIGKQHMELLRIALSCDITRVASLQWSFARSTLRHTWLSDANGNAIPATNIHHQLTHDFGSSSPELSAINVWYAEQLAALAGQLDAIEEVDGTTLLDNSLVCWCTDVAWGYTHSFENIRVFLLGGAGGALKTGQHVVLAQPEPHQKLLVTLMNAMGVAEDRFGDTSYTDTDGAMFEIDAGPLPGVLSEGP
jgi:Protein of unknown function (DUF1552)